MSFIQITLQCSKVVPPWNLDCAYIDENGSCLNDEKSLNGKYFG